MAIVVLYALLLALFLIGPMVLTAMSESSDRFTTAIWMGGGVGLLIVAGLTLILVPVRVASRRPIKRSHIVWPMIGSGAMVGLLVLGAGVAIVEWGKFSEDSMLYLVFGSAIVSWLAWTIFFVAITWSKDPASLSMRLHRKVMAGSVMELLIAVPAHVVVRQRDECCAGIYTAAGICLGLAVLLVSCGPAVLLLYWRRWEKIAPK